MWAWLRRAQTSSGHLADSLVIAGLGAPEWAEHGIVLTAPAEAVSLTAEQAERIAITRHSAATNAQATLVHVEMPRSQFFPSADYWVVAATPPPGAVSMGGPARANPDRARPFVHMVVFVDAETGWVPLARMWG